VTAVGRCAIGSELEPETALVWEEAQKALRAALITQEESLYRFDVLRTHRILDLSTGKEVDQHVVSDVREARSPFRSLPPEDIARDGYTRATRGRTLLYGPNTDVLLSSGFLAAHCFGLHQDAGRPGQIGLTFEPAQGRDVPEIGGVLWLDEASAELKTLEFEYRNVPRYLGSGGYSGFAEFQRLEAGHWIIRHWWLRTPGVQEEAEVVRVERIR
jgi:hypothetical protein